MGVPVEDELLDLYPPSLFVREGGWLEQHMDDPPEPPPQDTREAELAALAAQEKLGHDGKRQRVRARRTVDPFGGLEKWKIVRWKCCRTLSGFLLTPSGAPAVPNNRYIHQRRALHAVKPQLPRQPAPSSRLLERFHFLLHSLLSYLYQQDSMSRQHCQGERWNARRTFDEETRLAHASFRSSCSGRLMHVEY